MEELCIYFSTLFSFSHFIKLQLLTEIFEIKEILPKYFIVRFLLLIKSTFF